MVNKILKIAEMVMPFLKKKDTKRIREFSELITGQYEFLVSQLEKVMKDYFGLSDRIKDMHNEILALRQELNIAATQRCGIQGCKERSF